MHILKGKAAVVSAATSGVGKAIAMAFMGVCASEVLKSHVPGKRRCATVVLARVNEEGELSAEAYDLPRARPSVANVDHAAAFLMGIGNRPNRAPELAVADLKLPSTTRSRNQVAKSQHAAQQVERIYEVAT